MRIVLLKLYLPHVSHFHSCSPAGSPALVPITDFGYFIFQATSNVISFRYLPVSYRLPPAVCLPPTALWFVTWVIVIALYLLVTLPPSFCHSFGFQFGFGLSSCRRSLVDVFNEIYSGCRSYLLCGTKLIKARCTAAAPAKANENAKTRAKPSGNLIPKEIMWKMCVACPPSQPT